MLEKKGYLLLSILLIPMVISIVLSYFQLHKILINLNTPIELYSENYVFEDAEEVFQSPEYYDLSSRVALELDVVKLRNHRISSFIETRTWMRFMSMMFGSILVFVGGSFIIGRVSSPNFVSKLESAGIGFSIASTSPGLILSVCGVILMTIPNVSKQDISESGGSTYLGQSISTKLLPSNIENSVLSKEKLNKEVDELLKDFNEE